MDRAVRVFLLDDHQLVRDSLRHFLGSDPRFEVCGEAASSKEALAALEGELEIDVAMLDVRIPDGDGVALCREIRSRWPNTRCLMLSAVTTEDAVASAILAGASGYLLKNAGIEDVKAAVLKVADGQSLVDADLTQTIFDQIRRGAQSRDEVSALTGQESRILELIGEGLTNREIAGRLHLAEQTVKNYVSNLLTKLGLDSRVQAAIYATERAHEARLHAD